MPPQTQTNGKESTGNERWVEMRCSFSGVTKKEDTTLVLGSKGSKTLNGTAGERLAQKPEATGSWGAQSTGRTVWYRGHSGRRVPLHMCGKNMEFPASRGQHISEQVWIHTGLCSLSLLHPHHLLTWARPGVQHHMASIPASCLRNLRHSSARVTYKGCPSCRH